MKKPFLIQAGFFSRAKELRSFFHEQFADPHKTQQKRFVWDYWHVKNQYSHMRTPAYHYFPQKIYNDFHTKLVEWGRVNLGCHNISPPWLSYYVDGHHQRLHADVPHGPWAFVYSLTPQPQKFSGGETLIMKDSVLNYWSHFHEGGGRESEHFFDRISPKFNQLLIFDARYPHGVEEVRDVRDPLDGRLVVHGWFVEPRPYVIGGLKTAQVQKSLGAWIDDLTNWLAQDSEGAGYLGTLTLRIQISAAGKVLKVEILTNTVLHSAVSDFTDMKKSQELIKHLTKSLIKITFPHTAKSSQLTIPLVFK